MLEEALEADGEMASAHANLGYCYLEAGRLQDAAGHLDRAIGLGFSPPRVLGNKLLLLLSSADTGGMIALLSAWRNADPNAGSDATFRKFIAILGDHYGVDIDHQDLGHALELCTQAHACRQERLARIIRRQGGACQVQAKRGSLDEALLARVRRLLPYSGVDPRNLLDFRVAFVNSKRLHASTINAQSGVLATFDQTLVTLLWACAAAYFNSRPTTVDGISHVAAYSEDVAIERLRDVFQRVLGGQGLDANRCGLITGKEPRLVEWVASRALDFAIAHELAHMALGHMVQKTEGSAPSSEFDLLAWQAEVDADSAAIDTVSSANTDELERSYIGPTLFFSVADVATSIRTGVKMAAPTGAYDEILSHPPARSRVSLLIANTWKHGWFDQSPLTSVRLFVQRTAADGTPARRQAALTRLRQIAGSFSGDASQMADLSAFELAAFLANDVRVASSFLARLACEYLDGSETAPDPRPGNIAGDGSLRLGRAYALYRRLYLSAWSPPVFASYLEALMDDSVDDLGLMTPRGAMSLDEEFPGIGISVVPRSAKILDYYRAPSEIGESGPNDNR